MPAYPLYFIMAAPHSFAYLVVPLYSVTTDVGQTDRHFPPNRFDIRCYFFAGCYHACVLLRSGGRGFVSVDMSSTVACFCHCVNLLPLTRHLPDIDRFVSFFDLRSCIPLSFPLPTL